MKESKLNGTGTNTMLVQVIFSAGTLKAKYALKVLFILIKFIAPSGNDFSRHLEIAVLESWTELWRVVREHRLFGFFEQEDP